MRNLLFNRGNLTSPAENLPVNYLPSILEGGSRDFFVPEAFSGQAGSTASEGPAFGSTGLSSIAEFACSEDGVYMAIGSGSGNNVKRSIDLGKTWFNPQVGAMNNVNSGLLYCGRGRFIAFGASICKISTDYGLTFGSDINLPSSDAYRESMYLGNGKILQISMYSMRRSTDYGATWTGISIPTGMGAILNSGCNLGAGTIVVGGTTGTTYNIIISYDYGATWVGIGVMGNTITSVGRVSGSKIAYGVTSGSYSTMIISSNFGKTTDSSLGRSLSNTVYKYLSVGNGVGYFINAHNNASLYACYNNGTTQEIMRVGSTYGKLYLLPNGNLVHLQSNSALIHYQIKGPLNFMTANKRSLLASFIGVNFNSTSDQIIRMLSSNCIIRKIIVQNASVSLTTAVGGIYTAASKGGTAIVAASQTYSALTASTKFLDLTLDSSLSTDALQVQALYLSLTTAQGATATADVFIYGDDLTI